MNFLTEELLPNLHRRKDVCTTPNTCGNSCMGKINHRRLWFAGACPYGKRESGSPLDFKVFADALSSGGAVKGICISGAAEKYSRKGIDKLTEMVKQYGAKGMVWIKWTDDGIASSVSKFFDEEALKKILDLCCTER